MNKTPEEQELEDLDNLRMQLAKQVNDSPLTRQQLEEKYGADNVFDTTQLQTHFEVVGFAAPFVAVVKKDGGVKGSLMFQHYPRFYFGFTAG